VIGSILKLGAALAGLAQDAFAYFRKKDDQNTGRQLQASDDRKASIDAAKDTRTDEDNVHRLSDDELNRRLRGET
jgi:hypothetical protein